jgi:hypothetical protein
MKKVYVLFAISDKPINLRIANRDGVQHFVHEELELELDCSNNNEWKTKKDVPHHRRKDANPSVSAVGETVSVVVVNWLKNLVGNIFDYTPFRDKKQEYFQDGDFIM